MLIHQNSL